MRKHKRRGLLWGMLAFSLAIATGWLFQTQVNALEQQIGARQTVVVARQPIPPRTLITADMLETRDMPQQFAHTSYIQNAADVVDQRVTLVAVEPGVPLRTSDVAPVSGLNDGFRAVAIGVNPISVQVDQVQAGTHVDVLVSYETTFLDKQGQEVRTKRTQTILQDMMVLAVNGAPQTQTASPAPSSGASSGGSFFGSAIGGTSNTNAAPTSSYSLREKGVVVTLKASPGDAQKLAYVDTFATDIRLATRRADDRAIVPVAPVMEEDFK